MYSEPGSGYTLPCCRQADLDAGKKDLLAMKVLEKQVIDPGGLVAYGVKR